jgi:HAMP domain-containing protein
MHLLNGYTQFVQRRNLQLVWKIAGTLTGMMLLLGLLIITAVYHLMAGALRNQLDQRAFAIATNLSDGTAAHIAGRNLLALHALIAKYSLLDQVAYAFVEDQEGKVIAHTLAKFPPELQAALSGNDLRDTRRRTSSFRGKQVYETRVPILEGQIGAVHVGIWEFAVEQEIRRALLPLIGITAFILLGGVTLSILFAKVITRPILQLRQIADQMSKGDLDIAVGVASRDEIGDLAGSLERMRSSLKAAMSRLRREQPQGFIESTTQIKGVTEGL